jgi:adenylate cyclase class 2
MPDAAHAARLLESAGFLLSAPRAFESNALFDFDDSRLRNSRQLLRLRYYRGAAIVTYKGPPLDGRHKVREEVEIEVSGEAACRTILQRLGLSSRYRYEKFRTEYHAPDSAGAATIDETPIGVFVELEGPPDWIDRTAAAMGFSPDRYILASYGRLWEDHAGRAGIPLGEGMVFPC